MNVNCKLCDVSFNDILKINNKSGIYNCHFCHDYSIEYSIYLIDNLSHFKLNSETFTIRKYEYHNSKYTFVFKIDFVTSISQIYYFNIKKPRNASITIHKAPNLNNKNDVCKFVEDNVLSVLILN